MKKITILWLLMSSGSHASEIFFNPDALAIQGISGELTDVDLSFFEEKSYFPPGVYQVDIYLNDHYVLTDMVTFTERRDKKKLLPIISPEMANRLHIQQEHYPLIMEQLELDGDVKADFLSRSNQLRLSLPEAYLLRIPRGWTDPTLWDQGINALRVNYLFTGFHSNNTGGANDESYFLSLNNGLNLGAWRVRNNATYRDSRQEKREWNSLQTYVQRDIQGWKSQLTLGEYESPSELFDGFSFTGVMLESDEAMRPDSMRGYAPVIRGTALSNARVIIKQGGFILYEKEVSPGPFIIDDLYQNSSGERLEVIIRESNGEERIFYHDFSAVPIMERDGSFRYSLLAGKYRYGDIKTDEPEFTLGTLVYGLPYDSTLYAGLLGAKDYYAGILGAGKSFGQLGALSFDATYTNNKMQGDAFYQHNYQQSSQSYRLQYAKKFTTTDTYFTFAAQHYEQGYLSFKDAVTYAQSLPRDHKQIKTRYNLQLSQYLGDFGSLYFSANQQKRWDNEGKDYYLNAGYSYTGWKNINYTFNYSHNKNEQLESDSQFSFAVRIPFDALLKHQSNVNYQYLQSKNGRTLHTASFSGTALENRNLSYSLQHSIDSGKQSSGDTSAASLSYLGAKGRVSTSYSHDDYSDRFNYSLSGGIVAHRHGVTLSQPMGETIAIIDTEDVADVPLKNHTAITTDYFGNAVLPHVVTYRENQINLDVDKLEFDVDTINSARTIIPTRGAVVRASFGVKQGYRSLVTLQYHQRPLPFGTIVSVTTEDGKYISGIVGEGGDVYLSGLEKNNRLDVTLPQQQHCSANYRIDASSYNQIYFATLECQ